MNENVKMRPIFGSTYVRKVGYDEAASIMYVKYIGSDKTFAYADVPKDVYQGFIDSPSKGSYIHKNIKGKYQVIGEE